MDFRSYTRFSVLAICAILLHSTHSQDVGRPCEVEKYKAVFNPDFLVPKCSPNGLYEPVQCDSDDCWCVVKETGEEIATTRVRKPSIPNCDYPALGVSEVDLIKAVIKNKGDDIVLVPDSFNKMPSYDFQSSRSVYALARDYLPPKLWENFSILATVRPMTLDGGFLFAIVDNLESVIQLGVSISRADNEYTQKIHLWYSEDPIEQGSTKIATFIVPIMVNKWSRFAIGINGTDISFHVYCQQNYGQAEYKRTHTNLKFIDDSFLLVGHGGDIFADPFRGDIQELLLTNDPMDAVNQCVPKKVAKETRYGMYSEVGFDGPKDGRLDLDNEPGDIDADTGSGDFAGRFKPFDPDAFPGDFSTAIPPPILPRITERIPAPQFSTTTIPLSAFIGMPGEKGDRGEKGDQGDIGAVGIAVKGEKGDSGMQGLPGQHGVNGIPGLEGAIGPRGLHGEKGAEGDTGVGEPGAPGIPGESIIGESGRTGARGEQGEQGMSVIGPKGEQGKSFFMELEEMMAQEGSGEGEEDIFMEIPALELLRGNKGEPGNCTMVNGLPGRDGADGVDGQPGLPGVAGARGDQGEMGIQGQHGTKGESGMKGDIGSAGSKGETGAAGGRGSQGLQGPPGPPAVIGADGALMGELTGTPGEPGVDGQPGIQGEKGEAGEKGETGPMGETGLDGEQGPQGSRGTDGSDGEPGLPGAHGRNGVYGLDGIKGEKGEIGVGVPGPPGPPGPSGTSSGKPFFGGDEQEVVVKGEKGARGESGSFDISELNNIIPLFTEKGSKGDEGGKGEDGGCKMCVGFKGSRGRRGRRGADGLTGKAGPKGEFGAPGFPGQNGIPGAPGTPGDSVKGEKGDSASCECSGGTGGGEKGEKGSSGEPGAVTRAEGVTIVQGPPGPPGAPGETIVGLQGPPGPRGFPGRDSSSRISKSNSLGDIVMFANQQGMSSSSLAMPSGTLAFVIDQQRLYIRVNLGWQAISMGPIVPMSDGEFSNSLPGFLQENPLYNPNMKDAAAAAGSHKVLGVNGQKLRLYALNTPLSAVEIFGVSGADYKCYQQARQAKISGTFRAVLTSRLQSIDSLVFSRDQDLSIVNGQDERVLDSWSGVTKNKGNWVASAPIYTFDGANIHKDTRWASRHFWHGARTTGKADTSAYCHAWTSESSTELGVGSSYMTGQMLDKSLHTCDTRLAVLCVETTLPEMYGRR